MNCGNFQIDNRHQYLLLKKIAYLYYRKKGKNNSLSEIISEIAAELNLTEESVENYLVAVSTFKPKYNADFYASDDEDDFYCGNVVLTAAHDFIFVRSDIAVVKIFECGHCCHLPFQAQQDTTEKEKVQNFFTGYL